MNLKKKGYLLPRAILLITFVCGNFILTTSSSSSQTSSTSSTTSQTTSTSSSSQASQPSSSTSSSSISSGSTPSSSTSSQSSSSALPSKHEVKDVEDLNIALVFVNFIGLVTEDGKKLVQIWSVYSRDGTNEPKVFYGISATNTTLHLDFPHYTFSTAVFEAPSNEYASMFDSANTSKTLDWDRVKKWDKVDNYPQTLDYYESITALFTYNKNTDFKNVELLFIFASPKYGFAQPLHYTLGGIDFDQAGGKGRPTNSDYVVDVNKGAASVDLADKTGIFFLPDNPSNRKFSEDFYNKHGKPFWKKAWFIVLIIIIVILVIIAFMGGVGAIFFCCKSNPDMTEKFVA